MAEQHSDHDALPAPPRNDRGLMVGQHPARAGEGTVALGDLLDTAEEFGPQLVRHGWAGDDEGHNCYACQEQGDSLHMCWPQAHVCGLCEKAPLAWPDVMCEPCRALTDATSDQASDPVERLLSAHARMEPLCREDFTMCRCALSFTGGPAYHRRHLAELIYDALGLEGPAPWVLGERSSSRGRFDERGRVIPDDAPHPADPSAS